MTHSTKTIFLPLELTESCEGSCLVNQSPAGDRVSALSLSLFTLSLFFSSLSLSLSFLLSRPDKLPVLLMYYCVSAPLFRHISLSLSLFLCLFSSEFLSLSVSHSLSDIQENNKYFHIRAVISQKHTPLPHATNSIPDRKDPVFTIRSHAWMHRTVLLTNTVDYETNTYTYKHSLLPLGLYSTTIQYNIRV